MKGIVGTDTTVVSVSSEHIVALFPGNPYRVFHNVEKNDVDVLLHCCCFLNYIRDYEIAFL